MATLAEQTITQAGIRATFAAADAAGDRTAQQPGTVLHVKNASAASINVTVVTPGVVGGDLAVPDRVIAVPVGEPGTEIDLTRDEYRHPDGTVRWTYSAVATVTVAVKRIAA